MRSTPARSGGKPGVGSTVGRLILDMSHPKSPLTRTGSLFEFAGRESPASNALAIDGEAPLELLRGCRVFRGVASSWFLLQEEIELGRSAD